MELTFIDNNKRELILYGSYDHTRWALLFTFGWFSYKDGIGKQKSITISFLCFTLIVEYWRWFDGKS